MRWHKYLAPSCGSQAGLTTTQAVPSTKVRRLHFHRESSSPMTRLKHVLGYDDKSQMLKQCKPNNHSEAYQSST